MNSDEMLEKIYHLQNESNERDARLEEQMSYLNNRMDKTESLLEKMSNVLNEQKHMSTIIDSIVVKLNEARDKTDKIEKRVDKLEKEPANKAYNFLTKVFWIIIPLVVTFLCSGIFEVIKNYLKG